MDTQLVDVLPDLWQMPAGRWETQTFVGGLLLLLLAALLWVKTILALVRRDAWEGRPNPAHLRRAGERAATVAASLAVTLLGVGLFERDWGWQLIGLTLGIVWFASTMLVGLRREQENPAIAETASTMGEVPEEPPPPPSGPAR